MAEDTFKPLLMGYLDSELTELEVQRVEEHLKECADCAAELQEFRKLKEVTHNMRVLMPDEKYWEDYWSHVYNRLERRIGWILTSLGAILLASYGLYALVEQFLLRTGIPFIVRIGVLALVVGFCTLLVSGLRERIFLAKSDKYERIKR
ncbi:MAG TPA: zf-HC2 domain-containing protein [Acidobacteriota bacterium]|nr:zf-HC2 domain-containing protein [Acidobacteriota bacterium]